MASPDLVAWHGLPPLLKPITVSPRTRLPQFEKLQPMKLAIYDVDVREKDNRKLKLGEQDFLGGWAGQRRRRQRGRSMGAPVLVSGVPASGAHLLTPCLAP